MAVVQPIKLALSGEGRERMERFLDRKVTELIYSLQTLHEQRLPVWRRAYEAEPAEEVREFPWHGASNLVVPIIAIHADTLLARVMAAIFKTYPLWVARVIGKYPKESGALEVKEAYESFMGYVGMEPEELDLYRVYHEWMGEGVKLGTSVLKCPMVTRKISTPVAASLDGDVRYIPEIEYEGPRPEKLPFNDFLMNPMFKTIESSDFKAHRIRYSRFALERAAWEGIYDKDAVNAIIGQPDLASPDSVAQQQNRDAGVTIFAGNGYEEYHVYECHFIYRVQRSHYVRLIVWFNLKNKKILRAYHNYYPADIFIANRLFYRDDYFYGYGFCETLATFQEELSQIHNGRRDNMTVSNACVWRTSSDSLLNKGYNIFPGAVLPAGPGELEPLQAGQPSPMSIDEERLTLELAERRSGVSGSMQGMGAGAVNKRGVYSSMGTLSLIQEGNTRTDLNITDMRYAHTKVGRLLSKLYAEFGIGSRATQFGLDGPLVETAFRAIKEKQMTLPIAASTASVNREVEKQSDMILSGLMQRHYQMITQMMQSASNQFMPPEQKKYLLDSIESANTLMQFIFKHFGYDEVERFVPALPKSAPTAQGGPPPQPLPQQGGEAAGDPLSAMLEMAGGAR